MFFEKLVTKNNILKYTCYILLFLCFSCKSKTSDKSKSPVDTTSIIAKPDVNIVSDSAVLPLSKEILSAIKIKDYSKLASCIQDSIRFSPYGHIDTMQDKKFSAGQLLRCLGNNTKIKWGVYDGSGGDILLTAPEYFQRFVYDVDFLNAPNISLNKTLAQGNALNNIDTVYKNAVYTEFYFPGFEKKYEGMDWCSLKLVFRKHNNQLYLIAIVHNQWTI